MRTASLALALLAVGCSPPELTESADGGARSEQSLPNCSPWAIQAAAPPASNTYLQRAWDWVSRDVMYCQCVSGAGGAYRTDCSGFVSYVWGLPPPGDVTSTLAGGKWDDGRSFRIGWNDLQPGDALNFPGDPSRGVGHVMLFGGWLDDAHTEVCAIEESHHGTPAHTSEHSIYSNMAGWGGSGLFKDGFLPIRAVGSPLGGSCDQACGNYGCACVDGQCNGGYCPGTGCSAIETENCGKFGAGCVDHQCNGGTAPGSGCTALEQKNCGNYGCGCVDHQCAGGYCPGAGCTWLEQKDCAAFACGCNDHQCQGGACGGADCTALEQKNCAAYGCGCSNHACAGGACAASACTAQEDQNCLAFSCGCSGHVCHGGACK